MKQFAICFGVVVMLFAMIRSVVKSVNVLLVVVVRLSVHVHFNLDLSPRDS